MSFCDAIRESERSARYVRASRTVEPSQAELAELAERAAEVRRSWDASTERKRRGGCVAPYTVPEVSGASLGLEVDWQ